MIPIHTYTQIATSGLLQCLDLWDFLHIKYFWELSKERDWDHTVQDSSKTLVQMCCKNLLRAKATTKRYHSFGRMGFRHGYVCASFES